MTDPVRSTGDRPRRPDSADGRSFRPHWSERIHSDRTPMAITAVSVVVLVVVLASGCRPSLPGSRPASDPTTAEATVREVIDGDTIIVDSAGDRERVRLIGIDTPETVHPTKPVECFGPEASARTKELLPKGTAVTLVRDIEARDRYGRLLAYVYRSADGLLVNMDLVLGGYATSYRFPPNDSLSAQFARAETLARSSRSGMWGECRGDRPG